MKRKTRIGVLGGGGIIGAHAPGYKASGDTAEVVAVAEPQEANAPRIRELFGDGLTIYPGYEELLADADVDAVDICLPHDLHMPAAVAAARRGRHVLVEKVMARNVWECDRMIQACDDAGVTLTVCHDRRYAPEWAALKQVIDSGVLGSISYWKLDHNQDVPLGRLSWAREWDRLGGGAIMSCLTHQIDALRWYGGEVDAVTCMTKVLPERMEGETFGVVTARMRSSALAQLSINWMTRSGVDVLSDAGPRALWYEMVQVCGTRGEAYYMSGRGTFVMSYDGEDLGGLFECEGAIPEAGFARLRTAGGPGHGRCVQEWVKLVRGEPSGISSTGPEGRAAVEVAEAAYLSAATGAHVALPIKPKPW